ncbi:hypothetical protein MLD38_023753 [Melastoma candidum]|uniref:Uncharacterized protein n=1 Tax=Melastoma candidum TaxID=119954 RepID=A0ACB9NSU8_9MYRT|nr:hypothetical protein MLD38_023753 [Melastoma candidum]
MLALSSPSSIVFRPDAVLMLLRSAYKDKDLLKVCKMAAEVLRKFSEPPVGQATPTSPGMDGSEKLMSLTVFSLVDYSGLFGEDFKKLDINWDSSFLNILDMSAIEEGLLHVLFACTSQKHLLSKMADNFSEFWFGLPLIQALLPALRPLISSVDRLDDNFSLWKQPNVQQALAQVVRTISSPVYRQLLQATAGYLSSFSQSQVKASCILIDLCLSAFAPWVSQVIAKVDLVVELLEDLLETLQAAVHSLSKARAALKYVLLAISGHVDDVLGMYKDVKHKILFLIEMLEPFLDPALATFRSKISFGDVCSNSEEQERICEAALNIIRSAVRKPALLPCLESEWRNGSVAPSVLLSILETHLQLPPEIDLCKCPASKVSEQEAVAATSFSSPVARKGVSSRENSVEDADAKIDISDAIPKADLSDDLTLLFAPNELRLTSLTNARSLCVESSPDRNKDSVSDRKCAVDACINKEINNFYFLDDGFSTEFINLQADLFHLSNLGDCESRASEFRRLALDLHSQDVTIEGHGAAIDALLLAAECYINPFFLSSGSDSKVIDILNSRKMKILECAKTEEMRSYSGTLNQEHMASLEKKRDKIVLQLLLMAAGWDREFQSSILGSEHNYYESLDELIVDISPSDLESSDAVTLVRQNQALLCNFLIRWLQRERQSMLELPMQSLLFLLYSATKLVCDPGSVIDIILSAAGNLNGVVTSYYYQSKDRNSRLDPVKLYELERRWILLQKLVVASTAGGEASGFKINNGHGGGSRYRNLIPPSAWISKIPIFSKSPFPLVRFLGWMAVSRNAKQYTKDRLFLASDLSQLTLLLSIFSDDLSLGESTMKGTSDSMRNNSDIKLSHVSSNSFEDAGEHSTSQSFNVIYPDVYRFFPSIRKRFESFGEIILQAVVMQLRYLPSGVLPDVLCWFSTFCLQPFALDQINPNLMKGSIATKAKAIILYILEGIISEHLEALVPETPRIVHLLASLCRVVYCDVSFLDCIMRVLQPIITYSLKKVSFELMLRDDSTLDFESLCFDELLNNMRDANENQVKSSLHSCKKASIIFVLASVLPNLSLQRIGTTLKLMLLSTDFAHFEASSHHNYLWAFQRVITSCKTLIFCTLRTAGIAPVELSDLNADGISKGASGGWQFLNEIMCGIQTSESLEKLQSSDTGSVEFGRQCFSLEEVMEFVDLFQELIKSLCSTSEKCWIDHYRLTRTLVISSAECYVYAMCLSSVVSNNPSAKSSVEREAQSHASIKSVDEALSPWRFGLQSLGELVVELLDKHCWLSAVTMLDCLLAVPQCFHVSDIVGTVCLAIKRFSLSAPKLSWRMQADKWLLKLFAREINDFEGTEDHIAELFRIMLGNCEPEQRFIALTHLEKLVGLDVDDNLALSYPECQKRLASMSDTGIPNPVLSSLVSSTWDHVAVVASSDTSPLLRTKALSLLVNYVPFAGQQQLQCFLASADSVVGILGKPLQPKLESPILRISLALIAGASLYSLGGDISLIPESIWRNIEDLANSKAECTVGELEKKTCLALCRLRNSEQGEKEVLREALLCNSSKQQYPDFGSTREAILQVLISLTSAEAYIEEFSKKCEEYTEVEEAEMELEVLRNEQSLNMPSGDLGDNSQSDSLSASLDDVNRLQQIKGCISALEKSRLREEIIARRQKKLLMRHDRQKFLEDASIREAELQRELDRERAIEAEKEIERQRLLEVERARTKELRHNLDLERERLAQRELQHELEQIESGVRLSRREQSSSGQRSRDRYRERENGRPGNEGSGRTSGGTFQAEAGNSVGTVPTVMLSGSRSYTGQVPTILQSRDRPDECSSSYEEAFDGSKDSGDASSIGDPESISAFEGYPGRQGPRGSKSRAAVERRERDRREGKWERKH